MSKYVSRPEQVPMTEHWAIITGSSVYHEEQGVWAPGHGYPAHSEDVIQYQAFDNEKEFLDELQHQVSSAAKYSYSSKNILGIHVDKIYTSKTVVQIVGT